MAEWFSIEVFSGDKLPASAWRYSYEDVLTEAAATSGALYWDWHDSQYGVVFEVSFETDDQWLAVLHSKPSSPSIAAWACRRSSIAACSRSSFR